METPKNHDLVQFHPSAHITEDHCPDPQVFKMDPSGLASASLKPQEISFSDAKPVHNYSIQTGEEFALEFMRDRFNPKKLIPDNSVDACQTPGYLELKGILGIVHTGSESGSDISMIAAAEKESRDFLQKNSSIRVDKGNNVSVQSMQSVPRASSDYNSYHTLMYTSSGASDSSSTKLKILCSFGGRILPRPSDGKLRYVGGETRIIRINKDITFKELWQKTTAIYEVTCAIKYQLPGEDLDALVSISSDEDLLNMLEECNILEDGEGSKKLRMFLFSHGDLDDAHFTMANNDGDSEMKYVVAVNGIDFGSRKNFESTSGNNLNELNTQNANRDASRNIIESVGARNSNSAGFIVPPVATEPSTVTVPLSSDVYETDLRFYHAQSMHHDQERQYPPHFGYNFHPPYYTPSEIALPPQSSYTTVSEQKGLEEMYLNSSGVLGKDTQKKDAKPKIDGLTQPENEKMQIYANEHFVSSQGHIDNTKVSFPVEEPPAMVPKLEREPSSKDSKGNGRPDEHLLVSKTPDTVTPSSEYFPSIDAAVPEQINSESDPSDLSYFESSLPSQRPFRSVRIPREQGELLSRISKSDDSHNSQFLVNQPHTDNYSQQDFVTASVEELQKVNVNITTEQSISNEKPFHREPETVDNGFKAEPEPELKRSAVSIEDTLKQPENSTNDAHGYPQPSTRTMSQEEQSVGVPTTKQGDILIDINDRFPRDLLSDIFSKAVLSEGSSDFSPLQKDGPGLSINIENHDPKHWSFFQRLAGDEFTRRDISLIDQDQVVYPSGLNKVEEEAPLAYDFVPRMRDETLPSEIHGRDGAVSTVVHADYDALQVKVSEGMQYDDLVDNVRNPDSEYEDGFGNLGLPALDSLLLDIDLTSLQIIKNDDLEELRELGAGTFGTVYHGKWRGSDVAIKRIKKSCFTGRQSEQKRLTMEFWREAEILSKLHHPNVVAFYGVVQDGPGSTLATVTEFMVDGSLRHVLLRKDSFRHLDRRKRLILAMDAAFGMEYLHSKNVVHFDLKCDNLLVNMKDPSRPICKVGDFGLSKIKRTTLVSGGVRGTLPWMAPELVIGTSNKVSEKVDVFSFGIVLWEILTGEEPYANMHYGAIIGGIVNNNLRPTIPSYCDAEWRGLMEQCWAPNPTSRPSFTEIASRLRVMSVSAQTRKVAS
ncbi:hypothetical protein CASFOL_018778 [Castilleja foliolosa]|uniref:Protein kinase domain-containing protein n=1 Tax=Castilleja foliolosa TaxID=1961234 RepID=A0ABD3D5P5_9LAMI